jgi:hypothetical protein
LTQLLQFCSGESNYEGCVIIRDHGLSGFEILNNMLIWVVRAHLIDHTNSDEALTLPSIRPACHLTHQGVMPFCCAMSTLLAVADHPHFAVIAHFQTCASGERHVQDEESFAVRCTILM